MRSSPRRACDTGSPSAWLSPPRCDRRTIRPGSFRAGRLRHKFGYLAAALNERQHLLAEPNEIGAGFYRPRGAALDVTAAEIEFVAALDPAWPGRHHDQLRRQKNRFLHAMRDEEDHLGGAVPHVENELLNLFARERVQCAERFVHEQDPRIAG